jgi:hypothetical protein
MGTDRTGIVPFLPMELLTKAALQGKVEHLYRHDAESFIWVLIWVCLRCENGVLKGTMLNEWLKEDALGCHDKRPLFCVLGERTPKLGPTGWLHNLALMLSIRFMVFFPYPRRGMRESLRRGWRYLYNRRFEKISTCQLVVGATLFIAPHPLRNEYIILM